MQVTDATTLLGAGAVVVLLGREQDAVAVVVDLVADLGGGRVDGRVAVVA